MNNNNPIKKTINDKYNPDVIKKFKEMSASNNNKIKPEFVNNYYKSITNQPIKQSIKSSNDLKLEIDKPNTDAILSSYEATLKERLFEQDSVNKSIAEFNKTNIEKQKPENITTSNFKGKIEK